MEEKVMSKIEFEYGAWISSSMVDTVLQENNIIESDVTEMTLVPMDPNNNLDNKVDIMYQAFTGFDALKSLVIPEGVKNIYGGAFSNCSSLEHIVLPYSLSLIDSYAFFNCKSLDNVVIPECVEYIGKRAFFNCTNLKTVIINGPKIEYIGPGAFKDCNKLEKIILKNIRTSPVISSTAIPKDCRICIE